MNEAINELAKEIVEKYKLLSIDLEEKIEEFLGSDINLENKVKTLEQLYLLQLYSNAYISPDPRFKNGIIVHQSTNLLKARNDAESLASIKASEEKIRIMQQAETNPFITTKKRLEDKEKFKGAKF